MTLKLNIAIEKLRDCPDETCFGVPCQRDTPKNALEETPEGWVFLRRDCPHRARGDR